MGKLFWLITGVALGFVGAHFVNQTTEGRRFFARVNRGMDELGRAFASGYREGDADEDADAEALSAAIRERG